MSIVSTTIGAAISPFRGYIYCGLAALMVASFVGYTLHERHVQHEKDVAAELKEIQVVARKDVLIEQTADATVAQAEVKHEKLTSAPPVSNLGLVCRNAGGGANPESAAGDKGGAVSGQPLSGDVFDPSGDLLTNARLYEATIGELQTTVSALRAELAAAAQNHTVKP